MSRSYWTSYGVCYSWLAVPTWQGVTFEFSGSLVCGILTSLMFDYEIIKTMSVHSRIFITSLITTILVLISFHKTGGFFQPLLAFVRTYGCVGAMQEVTIFDHLLVYWLGATFGAMAAMFSYKLLRNFILKLKNYTPNRKKGREKTDSICEDPLLEKIEIFWLWNILCFLYFIQTSNWFPFNI